MAHAFPEDSRCNSNDDKAKLVVGPCVLVNRLGKQKKSFMTNAVPQDPDHDISVGAKIVPRLVTTDLLFSLISTFNLFTGKINCLTIS